MASTTDEKLIIEKIDIGGPSMIRAAAKNFSDVTVLASKSDYAVLNNILLEQAGETTLAQRRALAAKAFEVVKQYDIAIADYFNAETSVLRYGPIYWESIGVVYAIKRQRTFLQQFGGC